MKVTIPDQLKADVPSTAFGKILSATPVVMAVVATMLAGLASSEMTRAQYDRSLGAQQQSKAGDQWSFFQAKRLRGALQQNTVDLLESTTELHPFDPAALKTAVQQSPQAAPPAEVEKSKNDLEAFLGSGAGQQTIEMLKTGNVPHVDEGTPIDPRVKAAMDAMENLKPDSEMVALLAQVDNQTIDRTLVVARDRAQAFDLATKPINQAIDQFEQLLAGQMALSERSPAVADATQPVQKPAPVFQVNRDFTVARLRYASARYEVEARLNQVIANLYELQVRKSNISAEHHHSRSQRFFFGMLGAQLGVIISTFALAARNRSLLWSLAAGAGILAVVFAIYVYLYV